MDSVKPQIANFYHIHGCKLWRVPDQNANDFQKCLKALTEIEKEAPHDPKVRYSCIEL